MLTAVLILVAVIVVVIAYWAVVPEKPLRYSKVPSADLDRHLGGLRTQSLPGSILEIGTSGTVVLAEKLDLEPPTLRISIVETGNTIGRETSFEHNGEKRTVLIGDYSSQVKAARAVRNVFAEDRSEGVCEFELEYRALLDNRAAFESLREQWENSNRRGGRR